MVSINYATREVSCKVVYYGPGLSGKTTNLQYVHHKVPPETKGKLISLATDADRTLYFDFLPINIGAINGFAAKFQLYTVPGQVYYNATRKLVLRGTDGIVFVADSQPDKMDENIESLNNLKENLAEYGYKLEEMPFVIQYNKQDLPGVLSREEMHKALNTGQWPEFCASATAGFGVFDTLKCILKLVLDKARSSGAGKAQAGQEAHSPQTRPSPATPSEPRAPQPEKIYAPPPRPRQPEAAPVYEPVGTSGRSIPSTHQAEAESVPSAQPPLSPPSPMERQQVYRPFPGNTMEDEERMNNMSQQGTGKVKMPGPMMSPVHQGKAARPEVPVSPQMAPSLKVDAAKKKRSLFKRLFGLR